MGGEQPCRGAYAFGGYETSSSDIVFGGTYVCGPLEIEGLATVASPSTTVRGVFLAKVPPR
jgi:hypothetical protein